ncbi:cell wall-binding repeat-containing protein [Herbiconiux liangxiaofengii]|uniref:cell wall-binding repeat-containing protein n=1 Tax=Herbiconiux liangxiaofengii TaxID=3342795 RepID=UPI0035B6EE36
MPRRTLATLAVIAGCSAILAGGVIAPAGAATPGVERISGADRYAVSAAISANTFTGPDPVPIAYVVSGEVFSDALSASALAGLRGGPVLLTTKNAVPEAVRTELSRIDPVKIIVLGGAATISDAVYQELRKLSPTVTRIGGADRFEVSASAVHDYYSATTPRPAVPMSFVASGANFPDALSGAAAAGHLSGPVLLTSKDRLPDSVLTELKEEKPKSIRVLGGPNSVDQSVIDTLTSGVTTDTARVPGADRFAVSAKISETSFGERVPVVYIASGEVFPDALSGSAAAIAKEAPVLLVTKSAIPGLIATELQRLKPAKIVVLGGTNTIDAAVEAQLGGFVVK